MNKIKNMTNTNKKEYLIYLDSKNAKYNSNKDFQFFFKNAFNNIKSLQLVSFNIPLIYNNVEYDTNTLTFINLSFAKTYTVTIPTGNYDPSSLCSAIKLAMDTASQAENTFTVTFSDITNKITITSSNGPFSLMYDKSTIKNIIGLTGDIPSYEKLIELQDTINLLPFTQLEIRLPGLLSNSLETVGERPDLNDLLYVISTAGTDPYSYMTNSYQSNEIPCRSYFQDIVVSITDEKGFTPYAFDIEKHHFSILLKAISY